jgi:hypothetical protein
MVAGLFASHDALAALDEYIGSKVCRNCHTDHFNGWAKTAHNQILSGGNSEASYINDGSGSGRPDFFDGVEHDLRDLPGGDAFLQFGNDAPVIGANANGPYVKIGGAIYDVQWALGGSAVQSAEVADTDLNGVHNAEAQWRQLFLAKVGASRYLLPFQFNAKTAEYVPYHTEDWYDANGEALPITRQTITYTQSYERRCAGCHSTGVDITLLASGEWSMTYTDLNVACESCHGPGRPHVEAPAALKKATIINPATLTTTEDLNGDTFVNTVDDLVVQNYVCYQCHQKGTGMYSSLGTPETTLLYPSIADATGKPLLYQPGTNLAPYFDASVDPKDYWGLEAGDFIAGASSQQQGVEHDIGPHAADEQWDHACFSCHAMHNTDRVHLLVSENEGVPVPQPNDRTAQRNNLCLSCHATHGDFTDLTQDDLIAAAVSGSPAAIKVTDTVRAHVKNRAFMDVGFQTRCISCHMPFTGMSALEGDLASHTFEVIWPGFVLQPADFQWTDFLPTIGGTVGPIPDSCLGCHNPEEEDDIVTQWAESGHADGYGEPFNHWNEEGEVAVGCARCHSGHGFKQLADSSDPVTGIPLYTLDPVKGINPTFTAVTAQSVVYPKVLSCETCHEENGGGETVYQAGKVQQVVFPSGALKTLGNSSNICMQCHQGRESGKSIELATPGTTGYYRFINRHYFAEAAIFFGSEVTAGYEYPGRTYRGKVRFAGHEQIQKQDCVSCHVYKRDGYGVTKKDHNFFPELEDCNYCHWDANWFEISDFKDLGRPFGYANTDYDGDGVGESFRHEIDGMQAILLLAMNTWAKSQGLPPITYSAGGYPYFFTADCYLGDPGCTPVAGGSYSTFDKRLLQAAFNYHSAQDPGSGIHNYRYVTQTVFDSIRDMDPTAVEGMKRN